MGLFLVGGVIFSFWYSTYLETTSAVEPVAVKKGKEKACLVAGCSSQLCVSEDMGDIATTCEYLEEYACYRQAKCEVQNNGECGWTVDEELNACLNGPTAQQVQS